MLILCDFDGTITERDVTDILWSDWIPQAERVRMVGEVTGGRWSMQRYIAHGYSFVRDPPEVIRRQLKTRVQIRAGWSRFLDAVGTSKARLHIVSNGLDFYIRDFVPANVQVSCFSASVDGKFQVHLPDGCVLSNGEEFKVNRVRQLVAECGRQSITYVGDGRADFEPALLCSRIFAVRNSQLAFLCRAHSIATIEFDTFDTVADCLRSAFGDSTF